MINARETVGWKEEEHRRGGGGDRTVTSEMKGENAMELQRREDDG